MTTTQQQTNCPTCHDEMYVGPEDELCPAGTCAGCRAWHARVEPLSPEAFDDDPQWDACEGSAACCWGRGMGK